LRVLRIIKGIKSKKGDGVMKRKAQTIKLVEKTNPEHTIIKTTLYDLIEAIGEELKADEEDFIIPILSHMFSSAKSNLMMV